MKELSQVCAELNGEISDVLEWADNEYAKYFGNYFKDTRDLYDKMKDGLCFITDGELEWILSSLPLELFVVAENLSKIKTTQEVIKIHIKEVENEYIQNGDPSLSVSRRKEIAPSLTLEDKLLVSVYTSILERAERECSFCRELIMSAKKIWDSRRAAEGVMPVSPVEEELPEYIMK